MKALTLTQPWATLVAVGAKRIETRSWQTSYRGQLAIHAAKGFPKWAREFTAEPVCYEAVKHLYPWKDLRARVNSAGSEAYPLGVVIATCKLVDCRPTERFTRGADPAEAAYDLTRQEEAFGDYSMGRFAWFLDDIKILGQPIAAKGALGLWNWEPTA
jgi:hypothetical protein